MRVPEGRSRRRETCRRAGGPGDQGQGRQGRHDGQRPAMSLSDIESWPPKLKKRCGSGGTVREGVIEIQGDHRDVIVAELVKLGWAGKKGSGG